MKHLLITLLASFLVLNGQCLLAEEETPEPEETPVETNQLGPEINAPSGILIDAETGTVLAKKNSDAWMDPASLNKVMAVYLGTESLKDDHQITMSKETFESYDHTRNVIWIMENETISAKDAEFASLVQNANDTTAMIAEAVSGNQTAFVEKMNAKAEELSMSQTHFDNIFGFYAEGQHTTAEDMAILVRKAIKNKTFAAAFGASSHSIPPTYLQPNTRVLANNCELLRDNENHYDDATGCKVGYTQEGGFVLAAVAKRNGMELIVVLLGEESEQLCYEDAKNLFNYGFREYQMISITPEDIGTKIVEVKEGNTHIADVSFKVEQGFSVLLPSSIDPESLQAEVIVHNETSSNPKDIYAEVHFLLDGEMIGTAEMTKNVMTYEGTMAIKEVPSIRKIFDYTCLGVLGAFIIYRISRILMPPQD